MNFVIHWNETAMGLHVFPNLYSNRAVFWWFALVFHLRILFFRNRFPCLYFGVFELLIFFFMEE